jgi:hypothetical protein
MELFLSQSIAVFLTTLVVTALAALLGSLLVTTRVAVQVGDLTQFSVIESATLTLLGLVIGFTFAMAVSRYDQRKNLEEEEANAIGTEYVRAALLPEGDAARVRARLRQYVDQRIAWYTTIDATQLRDIDAATARTQDELWDAVRGPVTAQQNSVMALVAAGMNTVINSQGYTQAAFWNRIPQAGWLLLLVLSFCANVLVGMGAQAKGNRGLIYVLPVVIALAFVLIADIDSPRRGLIAVKPLNLLAVAQSLGPR